MSDKKNILIIDDDEINNLICLKVIKDYNKEYDVVSITSATDGLGYIRDQIGTGTDSLPDLIFLDINMPLMNGWDFMMEYRKIMSGVDKEVKLFVLTSSQYYQDAELAKQYNEVKQLITKPLTSEILDEIEKKYF